MTTEQTKQNIPLELKVSNPFQQTIDDAIEIYKQNIPLELKVSNPFQQTIDDAIEIYKKHLPVKGESWRTCNLHFLFDKLEEEYREIEHPWAEHRREVLDFINVALMIGERLRHR